MKNLILLLFTSVLLCPDHLSAQQSWLKSKTVIPWDNNTNKYYTLDSTLYFYSGNIVPGHTPSLDTIWSDSSRTYSGITGLLSQRELCGYTSSGNILTRLSYYNIGKGIDLQVADSYKYVNNRLTEHIQHNAAYTYAPVNKTNYTYNTSGLLTEKKIKVWNVTNNAWEGHLTDHYTYNNNGLILTDTTDKYDPDGVYLYTTIYLYSYNIKGENDILYTLRKDTSGIDTTDRTLYVYDNRSVLTSDTIQLYLGGNNWANAMHETYQYNASLALRSKFVLRINGYQVGLSKDFKENYTYSYNTQHQLIEFDELTGYVGDTTTNRITYYQYTNSLPASAAVAKVNDDALFLYPVPVNGLLNIKYHTGTAAQVQFSITDMQGRVVMQWQENVSSNYHIQVITSDLSPGMYLFNISEDGKQISRQFVVSR